MRAILASLLLGWAAPAGAACPDAYNALIVEALRGFGERLSCEEVRKAARLLPIRSRDTTGDSFAFAGEEDFRARLAEETGVRVPAEILPLGVLRRRPPAGPGALVIFGLHLPRRIEGLLRLAAIEGELPREEAARALGDGVWYDRVGFYAAGEDGRYAPEGQWLPMSRGGLWGERQREPQGVRACLPCEGWLCPRLSAACFSDFNDNQIEELHLIDDCGGGLCGIALLEPRGAEKPRLLLNARLRHPRWRESPEGWALVRPPACRAGSFCRESGGSLGNPNCVRPEVLVLRRGAAEAEPSERLQDHFFPIRRRPWPIDCRREPGPLQLVYDEQDGFIVYEK